MDSIYDIGQSQHVEGLFIKEAGGSKSRKQFKEINNKWIHLPDFFFFKGKTLNQKRPLS